METKTKVIILTVGLKKDGESGVVVELPVSMLEAVADRIVAEQEKCELCRRDGAVARLVVAYAELLGYEDAYLLEAREWRGI